MKTRILFILLFSSLTLQSYGQWQLGFGGVGLGPFDRFDSSAYKPGSGVFTSLMTSSVLPKSQKFELRFGVYFDYLNSGKKSFDIELADPITEEGEVVFKNYSAGHHFLTRFGYQVSPKVTVFTDGIIGHRKFVSQTTTGVKGYSEEYEDDIQKYFIDRTFRYGVGVGTRFNFGKSFGMEVRADYTRGNNATYFDLDKTVETDLSIEYETETWPHTDLFVYGISLNWKLFRIETSSTGSSSTTPSSTNTYNSPSRTSTTRTRTSTTKTSTKKKTVTPSKDIKKKEEKKVITW